MTHEPECPRMTCYQRRDELPCDNHECLCPIARAAYQRGMKQAEEIARYRHNDMMCCLKDDDCEKSARGAWLVAEDIAYAADHKESEPVVISAMVVDNLRNLKPLWADTPYGRIYFGGDSDCYCEDCNNPDCGCIDCGVARGDGEQA